MLNKTTIRIGVIAVVAVAVAKMLTDRVPQLARFKGTI